MRVRGPFMLLSGRSRIVERWNYSKDHALFWNLLIGKIIDFRIFPLVNINCLFNYGFCDAVHSKPLREKRVKLYPIHLFFQEILNKSIMSTSAKTGEETVVCVNCGSRVNTLYVQYSPGNIRLMKCDDCKAVADPYIECEFMIILIDLILHKPKAYRHLLYNMLSFKSEDIKGIIWKSGLFYLLLDAIRVFLLKTYNDDYRNSFMLMPKCREVFLDVLLGNIVFIFVLLLGTRFLVNCSLPITSYLEILLAVFVSSFFKVYLVAMMVWEFPSAVLYIIEMFVLSSNAVAFRVSTQQEAIRCIGICLSAHAAKFLADYWLLSV
ncbi:putative Arv1 protein [Dioscorea sansibarensis]